MITIDNKQYDLDSLSEDAKDQLFSLQFCYQERLGRFLKSYPWGRQGGVQ